MLQNGPFYSPGPITTDLLDAGGVQNFLDDTRSAFENSGWVKTTNVAGSGGTTGYVMRSRKPEFGARIKVKFYWDGSTVVLFGYPIIKFWVMDDAEVNIAAAGRVAIEAQKIQRIICGPYQFHIFFDFSVSPVNTTQGLFRNDASAGIPVMNQDVSCFWALGQLNSWRHHLSPIRCNATDAEMGFLLDGTLVDSPTSSTNLVFPELFTHRGCTLVQPIAFADGYYPVISPIMCMGTISQIKAFGIWDAIIQGKDQNIKRTAIADFHTWESFDIQPFDGGAECGCLWLATGSQSSLNVGAYTH